MKLSYYKVFLAAAVVTGLFIIAKTFVHHYNLEIIPLDRLHTSAISGAIFVIGFLLAATLKDYKEAERIPAEIAAAIENMNEDAISIKQNYPKFNLKQYQDQLVKVTKSLITDLGNSNANTARSQLHELSRLSADMETAGVPANFIVKIKQQQALIVRHLFRVNYIQRITFIPSANILAWSIVSISILLLLFTTIDSLAGSLIIGAAISFILVYVSLLINVIRTPFQDTGKTKDDVSLFLLKRTMRYLQSN